MGTKQLGRVSVQLTEPTVTASAAGTNGEMQSDSSTPTNYYFTVAADVTLESTAQTILNFVNDQIIPKGFCYLDNGNTPECNNDGLGTSCNAGKGTYIDAAGSSTVSISGISSTKEFKAIACSLHNWGYTNSQATSTAVNVKKVNKAGVPTVDITQGNVGATVTVTSTNAAKICYQSATGTTFNDPECKDDGTGCKEGKGTTITTTFSVVNETTNYKFIGCMNKGSADYDFHSEVSSVIEIKTIVTAEDPTIGTVNGGSSPTSQYVLTDDDETGTDGQITLAAPSTYSSGITTKQCYTRDATNPGCDDSGNCDSNSLTYSNGIIIQGDATISTVIIKAINCLPSPNENSNIVTIGTYTPVFQPQPIKFDGSLNTGSKEIAAGSSMQLEASYASHICYTVNNADDPVCTTTGCSTGTKISSKISPPQQPVYRGNAIGTIKGPTQALDSDGSVKAIACTDNVNDTPATGVSSKPYTIATITAGAVNMVGILYSGPTDLNTVRKGGAVTLGSSGAVRICYSIDSADAACGTDGCTAGTEISANEGVTSAISAATNITAIGCADFESDKATESFTLEVVQPVNMLAEVKSGTSTSTLKYGGRVQLSSSNAKFICYTSDGSTPSCAACNDDESCASDGNDACTTGSVRLTDEYTSIFKSIDNVTVKAIGCHTAQSTATETEFDIEATQATAPELTKVDIRSEDKIQIFIEAGTAVRVCWSHNASNVFCHQNGTCGGHIWPVNIIQATNEVVSTVDLGKFPSGMDFYAISCGRSGISGSSDSIVVHANFTLTPVTTQPPTTTTVTSTIAPTQQPTTATPELATTATPELATTTTPTCPNGCSGNGDCDEFGECQCMKGFDREDCSVKLVPLGDSVEFAILFGIDNTGDGYDKENNTIYTFNPKFDMKTKLAQSFLLEVCQRARADVTLKARPDWPQQCWIQKLAENVEVFPISPAFFPMAIEQFFVQTKGVYDPDIETHGEKYKGKIIWAALRFRINVQLSVGAFEIMPYYKKWKKFLDDEINPIAPPEVGYGKIVSAHFTSSDTEIEIIYSTIASFLTSNGICLVAIIIFTGDLLISGYAMLAIIMIVITLLGFLFGIVGFTFGAIEAVGVTIFVGMSVDYCLHLAHGYHSSSHSTRREKIQDALTHLGVSIVMGAITTGGAAIFLFFCYLYLFYQLGMMMFFNTMFALYFSLVFLSAMLVAAGPNGATCDVYAWPMIVIGLICGKNGNKKIDMTESQAEGVLLAATAFGHGEHHHDEEDKDVFEMI
jgi:hypothetical protein